MNTSVQVTTASSIEGWTIHEHRGLVSAHVVAGTGFFSDFAAGFSDFFGGRSGSYQKQLASLQDEVVDGLCRKALRVNANWVVGVRIDFDEISGKGMQMFMVSGLGTAVRATRPVQERASEAPPSLIGAPELKAAMTRVSLLRQLEEGTFTFSDQTWSAIAEHKVAEAIPAILWHLHEASGGGPAERERALELFKLLPAEDVQPALLTILEKEPELRIIAFSFIRDLDLVDLRWVLDHLQSSDIRLKRAALALLSANAQYYGIDDVQLMEEIVALVPEVFPDLSTRTDKKGMFSRTPEERWVCFRCKVDNSLQDVICTGCRSDRRGFSPNEFSPDAARRRLELQIGALRELLDA